MLFNSQWTFYRKNQEDKKIIVDLPYDAMLREERDVSFPGGDKIAFFKGEDYVYEKVLPLSKEDLEKVIYLRFEGIYHDPLIEINGVEAYKRNYGYTDFIFDATPFLKEGDNLIKVYATNSDQPNSRWYSGGGIYRDAHIYYYEKEHVLPRSFKIVTLDYKTGKVKARATLTSPFEVKLSVYDKENQLVYSETRNETKDPEWEFNIENVHLWNLDTPYLYRFVLEYGSSKEEKKFGVRQIELNPEKGFLINGIRTPILGGCIHSDNGMLGAESYPDVERRKILIHKKAGYNAIRSAHNPIVESFLDAADELGFLVMDEYVDCWYTHKTVYDYALHMEKNYEDDLRNLVDKDYSHPSVILYSTGNEVSETSEERGIALTQKMTDLLHSLDPSRPVTCGINVTFNGFAHTPFAVYSNNNAQKDLENQQAEAEKIKEKEKEGKKEKPSGSSDIFNYIAAKMGQNFMKRCAKLHIVDKNTRGAFAALDVAGYNYGILRYKKDLKKYPNRFILGSETFCSDAGYFYDMWKENPRVIGDFVWSSFDYLGEAGFNSWANANDYDYINDKSGWMTDGGGRIDLNGHELSEMDFTRCAFELDVIALGAVSPYDMMYSKHESAWKFSRALKSWTFEGFEGKKTCVEIYTRAPIVELYLNDKLLKKFKIKKGRYFVSFDTIYQPGELKAIAYDKNHKVLGEAILKTLDKETILSAVPEEKEYKVGQHAFVNFFFSDKDGNVKPIIKKPVEVVEVENCELVRYGNAQEWNKEGFFTMCVDTFRGYTTAIVKPLRAGECKIKVKSGEYTATATFTAIE